jgi:hypothetical protein
MLKRMKWDIHTVYTESRDDCDPISIAHILDQHKFTLMYAACAYDDVDFMHAAFDVLPTKQPRNPLEYKDGLCCILVASCPQYGEHIDGHNCGEYLEFNYEIRSRVRSARIFTEVARALVDTCKKYDDDDDAQARARANIVQKLVRSLVLANNAPALRALTGSDLFPIDEFITSLEAYDGDEMFCDFAPQSMSHPLSARIVQVYPRASVSTYHSPFIALISRDTFDARDFECLFHSPPRPYENARDVQYKIIQRIGRIMCAAIACDRFDVANALMRITLRNTQVSTLDSAVNRFATYVNKQMHKLFCAVLMGKSSIGPA